MTNLKKINRIALSIVIIVTSLGNCFAQFKDLTLTGDNNIVSLKMITRSLDYNGVAGEFRLNQMRTNYGYNYIGFADKNDVFLNFTNSLGHFYVKKVKVGMNGGSPHAKLGFDTTWNDDFVIGIIDFPNNFYGFGYRANGELRVQSGIKGDVTFGRRTGPNDGDFVENIRFVSNGNVGIGTSTPAYKLDVKGEINATGFKLNGVPFRYSEWKTSDLGNSISYGTGNVGIANTNPIVKLEIGVDDPLTQTEYLKVHGSASFNNDTNEKDLTQVSINTNVKVPGTALTVGGPTFIGSWQDAEDKITEDIIHAEALSEANLWVTNGIITEKYSLTPNSSWRDEVFKIGYKLYPLSEVEMFIQQHKHLPGILSENEVKTKGYDLHEMNKAFLEKIENLYLYSIDQEKVLKQQAAYTNKLEEKISQLDAKLAMLQATIEKMSK